MAKKKRSPILTLGLIGGGALLANELIKEQSGDRSANAGVVPDRQLTSSEIKELASVLATDSRFVSSARGATGATGTGLLELILISLPLPSDLTTLEVKQTVRSADDLTTYLVIQKPLADTEITDTAYFKVVHGPGYAGPQGPIGATGPTGPTGAKGLDGLNSPNWGGSLQRDSAFISNAGGYTNVEIQEELRNGLPIVKIVNTAGAIDGFYIRPSMLYKIEYEYKAARIATTGLLPMVYLVGYSKKMSLLSKANGEAASYSSTLPLSEDFVKRTDYVGGSGIAAMNIADNSVLGKLIFLKGSADTFLVNSAVITEVSLGEPVPSNLHYLPKGQMVYDVTTGEIGRYNGTAIVWAAA